MTGDVGWDRYYMSTHICTYIEIYIHIYNRYDITIISHRSPIELWMMFVDGRTSADDFRSPTPLPDSGDLAIPCG